MRDTTRAPYGDGNLMPRTTLPPRTRCNPHPSRGRQRKDEPAQLQRTVDDATRTPHGDGNCWSAMPMMIRHRRCNPHPSRGQQRLVLGDLHAVEHMGCSLRPLWGRQHPAANRIPIVPSPMQPAPLTGTATADNPCQFQECQGGDATRTPRGDGNSLSHASVALVLD